MYFLRANIFFTILLIFLPFLNRSSEPDTSWNSEVLKTASKSAYLSLYEKEVIFEINKMRSNPAKYAAEYLEPLIAYYNGVDFKFPGDLTLRTQEGISALKECIAVLKTAEPAPVLIPDEELSKAADDHVNDQSSRGGTGHYGYDNSGVKERIERYGKWHKRIAENIAYGDISPRQVVIYLLIDDGVPSRGHRQVFLQKDFRLVGVAVGVHPRFNKMCVMDFAGEFQKYASR